MTASLVWVPGKGDTVAPQGCERIVSIFEGHMRYDLQLAFRRIERVKSRIGYEGCDEGQLASKGYSAMLGKVQPACQSCRRVSIQGGLEIERINGHHLHR